MYQWQSQKHSDLWGFIETDLLNQSRQLLGWAFLSDYSSFKSVSVSNMYSRITPTLQLAIAFTCALEVFIELKQVRKLSWDRQKLHRFTYPSNSTELHKVILRYPGITFVKITSHTLRLIFRGLNSDFRGTVEVIEQLFHFKSLRAVCSTISDLLELIDSESAILDE